MLRTALMTAVSAAMDSVVTRKVMPIARQIAVTAEIISVNQEKLCRIVRKTAHSVAIKSAMAMKLRKAALMIAWPGSMV
jgi:hypothetical protein